MTYRCSPSMWFAKVCRRTATYSLSKPHNGVPYRTIHRTNAIHTSRPVTDTVVCDGRRTSRSAVSDDLPADVAARSSTLSTAPNDVTAAKTRGRSLGKRNGIRRKKCTRCEEDGTLRAKDMAHNHGDSWSIPLYLRFALLGRSVRCRGLRR